MSESNRVPSAAVFGCAGFVLRDEEARFFAETNPLGFILFARNIESPAQVQRLTRDLRDSVGRADAPILIDQEGGRVQRLKPPLWRGAPTAKRMGDRAALSREEARRAVRLNTWLIAEELSALGISVNCAPVLDVLTSETHIAIGDRAFSDDPATVADLGRVAVEAFLERGILPVIKHMPGHGRARVDSHHSLPVIEASLETLEMSDFVPFMEVCDAPLGMSAHLDLRCIDPGVPATLSKRVIGDVIRKKIGFDGFLFTDDISMKALGGDFSWRTRSALAAGCDAVLHCNADRAEMDEIRSALVPLTEVAQRRWETAQRRVVAPKSTLDRVQVEAELNDILGHDDDMFGEMRN